MNRTRSLLAAPLLVAAASIVMPTASQAQLFGRDGLFSRDNEPQQRQQTYEPDEDPQRVEKLENMVRQLTGQNEQLQFRVRQLEEQLRAQGGGAAQQPAPVAQTSPAPIQQQPQQPAYQPPPAAAPQVRQQQAINQPNTPPGAQPAPIDQPAASPRGGRRNDAFDPSANPNAPGAPRALGGGQMPMPANGQVGAPGGRDAGEPLDINRGPSPAPGAQASLTTAPPTGSPRDEFDLGIGYIQRKDYALAEETMRNFAQKYPNDKLVADATYWLGESQYQRQQYNDAAESFLAVTSKYGSSAKAPDSLLRLGQSLAALKQKEAACAAYGEVGRKYPKASNGVKQGVDREQKRIGC